MFTVAVAILLGQAAPVQAPAPPSCASPGHAQFDFFVGEWDVYANGSDTLVARSKWERLYNGCAVRENWMPLSGNDGGSLNAYDPATARWRQVWIGSGGGMVEFAGGASDAAIVLTGWWAGSGPNGEDGLIRMTYSRLDDGAVRQLGEFSADQGLSWQPSFDLVYRPREGE
jgi:hypothetical protein